MWKNKSFFNEVDLNVLLTYIYYNVFWNFSYCTDVYNLSRYIIMTVILRDKCNKNKARSGNHA